MRSFVDPSLWGGEPVRFSPDGRQFFVVTQRGDVQTDTNVYDLVVFEAKRAVGTVERLSPTRIFSFRSATNTPAISQAKWVDGGTAIALLGVIGRSEAQVYRLNVQTGQRERLTSSDLGVYAFDVRGDALIYFARVERRGDIASQYYPGRLLDRNYIEFVDSHWIGDTFATFASLDGVEHRQAGPRVTYPYPIIWTAYWISPDGERAIMTSSVAAAAAPPGWTAYGSEHFPAGGERFWQRVNLVDMRTAEIQPTLDAPTGQAVGNDGAVEALWSPDSRRVILTNVCLPLERDAEQRTRTAYIIDYSIRSRAYRVIDQMPTPTESDPGTLREVEWRVPGEQFIVKFMTGRTVTGGRRYQSRASRWAATAMSPSETTAGSSRADYAVVLEESATQPPMLSLVLGGRVVSLFHNDAALAGVSLTPIEPLSWTDAQGHEWSGMLSLPGDRRVPAPLVLQIGTGADFDRFMPEGSSTTAYAAQSLNAVGIATLRIRMSDVHGFGTAEEGQSFVSGIDAAVAVLSEQGLIDSNRVGLVGHSRGGYLTQLAITHPGQVGLRAAIAADSFSGGYFEYMHMDPASQDREIYERLYGGRPFWEDPEQWIALAPTFNANRSVTPLLLEPIGLPALLGTQELYASLRLNHRPVDLMYFPYGEHQLVRPSERLASITATIDWMRFWLQDYEADNADRREQYERWRLLRRQRDGLVGSTPPR